MYAPDPYTDVLRDTTTAQLFFHHLFHKPFLLICFTYQNYDMVLDFFKIRSNRSSAAASTLTTSGAMGLSEKTFLNPKKMTASKEIRDEKGPSLDDFDKEIEIYQVSLSCINPTDPPGCPLDRVFKEMEHFKEERT